MTHLRDIRLCATQLKGTIETLPGSTPGMARAKDALGEIERAAAIMDNASAHLAEALKLLDGDAFAGARAALVSAASVHDAACSEARRVHHPRGRARGLA